MNTISFTLLAKEDGFYRVKRSILTQSLIQSCYCPARLILFIMTAVSISYVVAAFHLNAKNASSDTHLNTKNASVNAS